MENWYLNMKLFNKKSLIKLIIQYTAIISVALLALFIDKTFFKVDVKKVSHTVSQHEII
jgi:uncharacterized membrane protein YbhN (UPF0104 family)